MKGNPVRGTLLAMLLVHLLPSVASCSQGVGPEAQNIPDALLQPEEMVLLCSR